MRVKKLSGYDAEERKSPNYWNNWDNLSQMIKSLIKNDNFPTTEVIKKELGNGAYKSVLKFGGIKVVAEKMGYDLVSYFKTSDGHYVQSSYEYLFDEFLYQNNIPHEVGGLISEKYSYRYDFKIGEHYVEIWGYEKHENNKWCIKYNKKRATKETLYQKLGLKLISIECGDFDKNNEDLCVFFKNIVYLMNIKVINNDVFNFVKPSKYWNYDNTFVEFQKTIKTIGRFPKIAELKFGLAFAIHKYGGIKHFKEIFGEPASNHWTPDTIVQSLKTLTDELGHFPTCNELKNKHSGLLDAIERNGKINKYRELLGYKLLKKHWTENEIVEEIKKVGIKLGKIPNSTDLIKMPVYSAIYRQKKNLKYL